jgi:hypothetical protein
MLRDNKRHKRHTYCIGFTFIVMIVMIFQNVIVHIVMDSLVVFGRTPEAQRL